MKTYHYKKTGPDDKISIIQMLKKRKIMLVSLAVFLFFLPIAYLTTRYQSKTEAAWLDDHWGYRQTVAITNAGAAQTDFQVQVTVDTATLITAGKMQSDCDDIRVTDVNGKILPYWVSSCNNASTKIWPKVPSIPTSGTIIYLYYGNPSAQSAKVTVGNETYPGLSCKSILDAGNSTGDGTYWLDTTNGSLSDRFQAYCDMTNDSGGWMLVKANAINSQTNSASYSTPSAGLNGGLTLSSGIAIAPTGCGGVHSSQVLFSDIIPWTQIKADYEFSGAASCWSVFGDNTNGVGSNLVPFAIGSDTIRNQVRMGGSGGGDPYDGVNYRCDNTTANFWHSLNGLTTRSAQVILRRNSMGQLGGLGTGNNCNGTATNWIYKNIYIRETTMASTTITVGAPANEQKSSGPVAYWKFDEGYGNTTYNSTSVSGINGTITGATWQPENQCVSGKCLYFDGSTALVQANTIPAIHPDIFTINMWIKPTQYCADANVGCVIGGNYNSSQDFIFYISNTGKISLRPTPGTDRKGNTSIPLNKWSLVTATYDGSTINIYLNGVYDGGGASTGMTHNTNPFIIGRASWYAGSYFYGFIDDVKVFNYARSAAQIKSDFASKSSGSVKGTSVSMSTNAKNNDALSNGLTTYLKSDEASGNGADSSGNANITTVSGASNYGGGKFGNGFRSGVATTNLVVNPSFETDLNSWTNYFYIAGSGPGERTRVATESAVGSYSMMLKHSDSGGNFQIFDVLPNISVTIGVPYTYSCWIKSNTTNALIDLHDGTSWRGVYVQAGQLNTWSRISSTFTPTATPLGSFRVGIYGDTTGDGIAFFDGCQLEQASTATPYTDGSLGTGYTWTGTAHASTSTRAASTATTTTNVNDTTGTIAFWFNSPSLDTSAQCPLGASDGDNSGGMFFSLKNTGIYLNHNYAASQNVTPQYVATINSNTWYHVAYNWDNTSLKGNLYVNGALQQNVSFPQAITKGEYLQNLGTCIRSGYTTFNGTLDDLRTYNRVLSPREIRDLYNWSAGPVGYWNMDEKTGGTANDRSGNGITATWSGSGTRWSNGKFGAAGIFDGSSDYLSAPSSSLAISKAVTLEAWINPTTVSGVHDILDNYNVWDYRLYQNGANLTMQVSLDDGNTGYHTANSVLSAGTWQHVSGVFDGSTVKLFVNGVQVLSEAAVGSIQTPGSGVYLGSCGGICELFTGKIDQAQVYNYPRTQKQIVEDMNAGHPAGGSPVGSQVGYWKFDEGADNKCTGGSNDLCNSGSQGSSLDGALSCGGAGCTGTPDWSNAGKFGKALNFNGGSDIAYIGNSTILDLTDTVTLSAWINPSNLSSTYTLMGRSWNIMRVITSGSALQVVYNVGGTNENFTTSSVLTVGVWQYIAVTYDRSNIMVYVNGKLVYTEPASGDLGTNDNRLIVGACDCGGDPAQYFPGLIDEVKLYAAALTSDEIALDYNRGASMVLGAMSDTSGLSGGSIASSSATASYCVPGGTDSCTPPVGEWNFEEKTGQTVNDTSGNGSSGTLGVNSSPGSDDPTWAVGKLGAGLQFDGGDYASVTDPTSGVLDFGTGDFTIESWFKTTDAASSTRLVAKRSGYMGDGTDVGYELYISNGTIKAFIGDGLGYVAVNNASTTNSANGLWHHATAVFSRSGNGSVYIDGKLDGSTSISARSATVSNAVNFNIGASSNAPVGSFFTGSLDQVKVFNYARTQAQIAYDYNRGAPVAHYKFDECQGITANDSSGNGNSGTITIGATIPQSSVGTCTVVDTATAWYNGATGKYNSSLNFDGVDDFVVLPVFNNLTSIADYSTSIWFYMTAHQAGTGNRTYLYDFRGDGSSVGSKPLLLIDKNPSDNLGILDAFTGTELRTDPIAVLNAWHNAVVTRVGSTTYIYLDGILIKSGDAGTGTDISTAKRVGTYSSATTGSYFFTGKLDDFKFYNYALTPQQIKSVFNQGSGIRFGPATGSP